MTSEILFIDPAQTHESPLLDRISNTEKILTLLGGQKDWREQQTELQEEWQAFCADVQERGVQVPLLFYTDSKGRKMVIDGRKRRAAAMDNGIAAVPAFEVPEADACRTALASVALRGHVPKGAIAFMTALLYPCLCEAAKGRPGKSSAAEHSMTFRDAAALAGVSLGLIAEAVETWKALKQCPPKLRTDLEAKITAGLISMGDARKAAASGKAQPPPGEAQTEETRRPEGYAAAIKAVKSLASRTRRWAEWDDDAREAAREELTTAARGWAPEFRAAMAEILTAASCPAE